LAARFATLTGGHALMSAQIVGNELQALGVKKEYVTHYGTFFMYVSLPCGGR
jgi:hypothetical protein